MDALHHAIHHLLLSYYSPEIRIAMSEDMSDVAKDICRLVQEHEQSSSFPTSDGVYWAKTKEDGANLLIFVEGEFPFLTIEQAISLETWIVFDPELEKITFGPKLTIPSF